MANVYIGTSGWMYQDWQGKFYPADLPQRKWLEYYSKHFKTVEVNSTFYHQMKPATFENWAKVVLGDFTFAIKANRFITHIKRLKDCRDSLKMMVESTVGLGEKLGPILFQCPPRWKVDQNRLETFLVDCKSLIDGRLAIEFRDLSWFDESIYEILRKHDVPLVIAESGGYWPSEEVITADFAYIRFHGEGGSYASKYTDDELAIWAKKIKKWQKDGIDVYAYFNNDVAGFAVENAKTLASLI